MPTRATLPPSTLLPPPCVAPRPLGERHDAKQISSFQEAACSGRRSLAKELMADRKR